MVRIGKWRPKQVILLGFSLALIGMWGGCGDTTNSGGGTTTKQNSGKGNTEVVVNKPKAPDFSADSAYAYIEKQLSFGPRIPNSKAHEECAQWFAGKLETYTPHVQVQGGNVTGYDGKSLKLRNIIASFNPEASERILLTTHWDSRPWADQDPDPGKHQTPVPGANDAASGAAVLVEVARQLSGKAPSIGVDLILFDIEDYGVADPDLQDTYCLGSQFWAKNPHVPNYNPRFGINLDMVGGHAAQFTKEGFSLQFAPQIVNKVWKTAQEIGYANYFVDVSDGPIIDDHYYVNTLANIPCIDIIARDPARGEFFGQWHTVEDDLPVISKPTLKAVGQSMLEVIFREKPSS